LREAGWGISTVDLSSKSFQTHHFSCFLGVFELRALCSKVYKQLSPLLNGNRLPYANLLLGDKIQ
jgi:hypothetical protein